MNQEGMTETHNTRTEATQYEPGGDASDTHTHTNTQRPLTMNQEGMPVTHTLIHTQATQCEPGGDASDLQHTHRPLTMNQEGMPVTYNTRTGHSL